MEAILAKSIATALKSCIHCGTKLSPEMSSNFCCAGCEFVYGLIQSESLGNYYKLREANPPTCPVPAQSSSSNYDFCDQTEFIAQASADGLKMCFYLEGMNCTACVWLLEKLPSYCSDAVHAQINMGESTIQVTRTPNGSFATIARTLNRFGYRPHPLRESETAQLLQKKENRKDLIRIGVAAACTGNIMIFAVSLYGGATGTLGDQFRWLSAGLALPVLTYCAWPFYRNTFSSFTSRQLNLDVPIVAALVSGIIFSIWGLFSAGQTVYFDSLSMLVFLLLSSRFVLKGVQHRQLQATHLEDELLLSSVFKLNSQGIFENVSSLTLIEGDLLRIDEGMVIPVDGLVETGKGMINTAVMSGESEPIAVAVGSKVEAGSQNLTGSWTLRVQKTPAQTRLAQILRDTERSAQAKSKFVYFSDRVSAWFIGIVFFIAALVVLWHLGSAPQEGIARALALVIVTCPCVFGIAIPLSMSSAIRGAARRGIIIKNNDAIERLWKTKTLFFDKTGTLTTGEMTVLDIQKTQAAKDNPKALSFVLGLEKNQTHPVARALTKYLRQLGVSEMAIENPTLMPMGGMSALIEGAVYSIVPLAENLSQFSKSQNLSIIQSCYGLFKDQELLVKFQLGDQPRAEALPLLSWARSHGLATRMISGDKAHVANVCGRILGFKTCDILSQVSPEEKAKALDLCKEGTAMIGDGANDAAALASADVGIAVCGSLDVSLRAADVYLTRPDLNSISILFEISRRTKFAIYRNLIFSASFNLISGSLAVAGLMTPLWAAVLMPLSSLTVLLSALWTGKSFENLNSAQTLTAKESA